MPTFSIHHGATALCTWDLESRTATLARGAHEQDGLLVVGELERCGFSLQPAESDLEYRISIGDVPLADLVADPRMVGGMAMLGHQVWGEDVYFESGRGRTQILLQARPRASTADAWDTLFDATVYVVPTKLGDDAYETMTDDLQAISRSLLVDLYGKSSRTYDVRFAREGRASQSREEELESIGNVVDRLGTVLQDIQRRPSSSIERQHVRSAYWGAERLSPRALVDLSRRGLTPRSAPRPIPIVQARLAESFDIPEHRVLKGFLQILHARADACARAAAEHIRSIQAERPWRDLRLGESASIYESVDLPKIARLGEGLRRAEQLQRVIRAMEDLPLLRNVRPGLDRVGSGVFQRSPEYLELFHLIRQFLLSSALSYEGSDFSAVTKLTWRLFEQWCFLRVVDAFRAAGVDLRDWTDVLRQNLAARFILDFDRGLQFEGHVAPGFRLRIRYEPWILGEQSAAQAGETLYRGSSSNVAWSPDVVVEVLKEDGDALDPVYVVVLDCKYHHGIREHDWTDTRKYFQIRGIRTRRQVVKQLWLIGLGHQGEIACTDPAVVFDEHGPSCPGDESVSFEMLVDVGAFSPGNRDLDRQDTFTRFAAGTLDFFRREIL